MPRSITQTTHPLSICNHPEEKLITAAVPSSPHYSPRAWAHPQSISVSSSQGTHQSGLSQHSKTGDICQDNLPCTPRAPPSCANGDNVLQMPHGAKPTPGRQSSCAASASCSWHSEHSARWHLGSLGSSNLEGDGISCLGH